MHGLNVRHTLTSSISRLDFMRDVEYLLNFLGVNEFNVHGVSGGGPLALAAAYYFDKRRLRRTSIVCGMTHPSYEQTSVSMRVRTIRAAVNWIPFYHRFGNDLNFAALLHYDLAKVQGNERETIMVLAKSQEARRQDKAGYRNDLKLFGQR